MSDAKALQNSRLGRGSAVALNGLATPSPCQHDRQSPRRCGSQRRRGDTEVTGSSFTLALDDPVLQVARRLATSRTARAASGDVNILE